MTERKFSIYVTYNIINDAIHLNVALTQAKQSTRTWFSILLEQAETMPRNGEESALLVRGNVDKKELVAKLREFCNQIEQFHATEE